MTDHPREADVAQNRLRQLNEPYPYAASVVDQLSAEAAANSPYPSPVPEPVDASIGGVKTGVPSNYEISLGGERKSMTAFEVKKSPGRM